MSILPGELVRKMGGGGRLVPLIGETQQFSSISCCNVDRYEEMTENSSRETSGESRFFSGDAEDSVELVGDDSCWRLLKTSRTKLKMRLRLSHEIRSFL